MKVFLNKLGMSVLPLLTNVLIATLRIKIHDLPDGKSNSIFIFWHSQMLIGWWLFKDKSHASLVSKSKDGEILSNILTKWNYKVIRGSSSKGGKEALSELIKSVSENNSAVVTPDGPRGPMKEMKNGIFMIANKCGIPIVPVKIVYNSKKIFTKSWDKFQVPLPFSACDVYFGNKFYYERYLDDEELNQLKKTISNEM